MRFDDFLNPDHFDPNQFHPRLEYQLAHAVIQQLKCGEQIVKKPAWNPKRARPPIKVEEQFSVEGIDIVLFEGEFSLCKDKPYDFSKYSQFGIFIDAQDEDILEWDWQRARPELHSQIKSEFVQKQQEYLQRYRSYVHSSSNDALYLLLKDAMHHYTLQINSPLLHAPPGASISQIQCEPWRP